MLRFPRAVREASSALLKRLRGLPCPVLPQESSHLPLQSTGDNQRKVLQHTFSNLYKCVAIFFMFWQAAVRRACSLAFFIPRNRQQRSPCSSFESAKLRSIFSFLNLYNSFPDFDKRFTLTFSLYSSHTCRVITSPYFSNVCIRIKADSFDIFSNEICILYNPFGLLSCRVIIGY